MGERKGQNKYYPPDYDPKKGGLNKFLGTHALRERARKLHMGILIIRFEMPYNIWCEGCGNHVGMGVRYNAEKKKVGMYYTTPIYQFRMKCHLCNNHYVIRTDPANLDYVIESGARRQDNRFQASENGTVVPDDKETIKRLASDPMFKLDRGDEDVSKAKKAAHPRINKIAQIQDRVKDDYVANRILRDEFRLKRKAAQALATSDKALLTKSCLPTDLQLLPESEDDSKMASLLRLVPSSNPDDKRVKIENESIFSLGSPSTSFGGKLKSLRNSILAKSSNSPFSSSSSSSGSQKSSKSLGIGVKRKIDTSTALSSKKQKRTDQPESEIKDNSTDEPESGIEENSMNVEEPVDSAGKSDIQNNAELNSETGSSEQMPTEISAITSNRETIIKSDVTQSKAEFSLVNDYSSSSNDSD